MKMTRKRVVTTAAIAAFLTAGVFGGTFAKYVLQVDTKDDSARVAKFYLGASDLDLFANTYDNGDGEAGADIATTIDNLIAPNFEATGTLTFDVTSEVKATLGFDNRTKVETNLPDDIQEDLKVVIGDTSTGIVYTGTVYDLSHGGLSFAKIKDVPAHTIGDVVTVPVTVSWALENGKDDVETALAREQYADDPTGGYTLTLSAAAVLTQAN
ncbi:hypothetical protein [Pseudolactococcus reticulitermitis]|uniref:Uncharacterized protein n=1 Tax=Pseudolactococcus reticulitermitis TaxID=2025039 RepID=A0A224XEL4_9LACT|nr:hypothetical protein [Lactococcus reticulitermitis]GAX48342.1 hypothetical protein RsY01_1963 [Lactococcus reticulitermitis]